MLHLNALSKKFELVHISTLVQSCLTIMFHHDILGLIMIMAGNPEGWKQLPGTHCLLELIIKYFHSRFLGSSVLANKTKSESLLYNSYPGHLISDICICSVSSCKVYQSLPFHAKLQYEHRH